MTINRRSFLASSIAALAAPALTRTAFAADDGWPRRPLTILTPFDVGGSADRMARGFAQYMPKYLGKPVQVVDRAGAGGMIGTTWFMHQPADGYTVMLTPATPFIPVNILVTNAPYKLSDMTFVNAQWKDDTVLLVPKDRPWKTAKELIDAIKASPGKISTGVDFGSVGHITTMALLDALGLKPEAIRIVTFDGAGAMRTALAGGQIDFNIGQVEGADFIKDFIRPLALFLDHRRPDYDVPPINEVLADYHTSVPIIPGSVRSFVYRAEFKAQHPDDYAKFVAAYRATMADDGFKKFLADNRMGNDWVGEEETTRIMQVSFDTLAKYKDLIKPS
ncbi:MULTISPECIES: tripartite tricarboxylate transporter substrate binding protein [unclassified Achromobacter]|uniref:Bug family tripartite tricarboxylate transporter substrate binding protein n=1 Tax=unclassified Achromobacter TaxID=2626865 RepID=UPI001303C242|nr:MULTISPECIES: tripartite tricarboxylate transporter substrate binding protein [unclassified Achromobacter]